MTRIFVAGAQMKNVTANSQLGFDERAANFYELITLLKTHGSYAPNETDLKIGSLESLLGSLQERNSAAVGASIAAKNARITRDDVFHK